jgi:NADH-quinone oxidoreductase subunit M
LPEAHVEAPTSGSILLAGILLKIATYGMSRFLFPLFPKASIYFSAFIITFNISSMLYAGLVTFVQDDIKKIIAYSSIVHMNYLILGLYSCELLG